MNFVEKGKNAENLSAVHESLHQILTVFEAALPEIVV